MPIYEYQCQACHAQTEVVQKFSDAPLTKCSHCQQDKLIKLVSSSAFQLKGTGWYVTDFKDSGKKSVASSEKGNVTTEKPANNASENSTSLAKEASN